MSASWFIDGSGQAQVFGKALQLPKVEYGRRKVCLWTYFNSPIRNHGTTFYVDHDEYMTWIWEIPINPRQISVGCVMTADWVKECRKGGQPLEAILRDAERKIAQGTMPVDFALSLHELANECCKIADHCTNISEQVIYLVTGAIVRHTDAGWVEVKSA